MNEILVVDHSNSNSLPFQIGQNSDDEKLASLRNQNEPTNSKFNSEKLAAIKSLKTNLVLLLLFILSNILISISSDEWKIYLQAIYMSFQKTFLPVVSTIANFGTVKSVLEHYYIMVFKKQS